MKKTLIFTLISLTCIACSDNSTSVSDEEFVEKMQVFEAKITWGNKSAMEAFRNQDKEKLAYFKTVDKSYRNKLMNCLKNK